MGKSCRNVWLCYQQEISHFWYLELAWTQHWCALQNTADPKCFPRSCCASTSSSVVYFFYRSILKTAASPPLYYLEQRWLHEQLEAVPEQRQCYYSTWGLDWPLSCVSSALCGWRSARLRPATPGRSALAKKSWLCWIKYTLTTSR